MEQTIAQLKQGNQSALKSLFDNFFKSGVLFVRNFIDDEAAAYDIVQEVFVNIWNNREVFSGSAHFRSYFYKSLKNRAFNHISRQTNNTPLLIDMQDDSTSVLDFMLREEVHRKIINAIANLPPERAKIIKLYMDGYSQEEISELLSISVNTIKTQKRKAYASLREELQDLFTFILMV